MPRQAGRDIRARGQAKPKRYGPAIEGPLEGVAEGFPPLCHF